VTAPVLVFLELAHDAIEELILDDDIAVRENDDLVTRPRFHIDEVRHFRIGAARAIVNDEIDVRGRVQSLQQPNDFIGGIRNSLRSADDLYFSRMPLSAKAFFLRRSWFYCGCCSWFCWGLNLEPNNAGTIS
jgi:hypothetical protein